MNFRYLLPTLLLAAWCAAGRAADDKDDSPEDVPRSPAELMKAVRMKPVTAEPGSVTWDEAHRDYVPWMTRVLVEPMRAKTAGHPQGAAAVQFAGEVLAYHYSQGVKDPARGAALLKQGQDIIAKGLDDPFVLWLTARAAFFGTTDEAVRLGLLEKARSKLAGAGYSALLTEFVHVGLASTRAHPGERDPLLIKAAEACVAMQKEPDLFRGDEAKWYIELTFFDFENAFEARHPALFEKVYRPTVFPEWARDTLAGKWEVGRAWRDRGSESANAKDAEEWDGFSEPLDAARTYLLRAWTANPKQPYAAHQMMSVVGGGHGGPGETLRQWFDRCTAGMFDYIDAYKRFIWFSRPQWGGSSAQVAAFGMACAATKRFDTQVPSMLLEALDTIADDAESLEARKKYFRDPAIGPAVFFVCESYAKQALAKPDLEKWQSRLAIYAWLAGDYTRSSAALKQLNGVLSPAVAPLLRKLQVDATELIAETSIAAAGQIKALDAAIAHYQKRSYPAARAAFIAVGRKVGPAAHPGMRRWMALVDIEERFMKGETVKLTTDEDLSLWDRGLGNWKAGPDGSLVATGWEGYGRIFHRARFGGRVELQADVEFSDPVPQGQGITLAICGRRFAASGVAWNGCSLFTGKGKPPYAGLLYQYYSALPASKPTPLKDLSKVHLLASCADKKMTFKVNDWTAFDGVTATRKNSRRSPFLYPDNGQVGFSHYHFISSHTITIRSITVRRLP